MPQQRRLRLDQRLTLKPKLISVPARTTLATQKLSITSHDPQSHLVYTHPGEETMNNCPSCDDVEMIVASTHDICCPSCGYSE